MGDRKNGETDRLTPSVATYSIREYAGYPDPRRGCEKLRGIFVDIRAAQVFAARRWGVNFDLRVHARDAGAYRRRGNGLVTAYVFRLNTYARALSVRQRGSYHAPRSIDWTSGQLLFVGPHRLTPSAGEAFFQRFFPAGAAVNTYACDCQVCAAGNILGPCNSRRTCLEHAQQNN